MSTPSRKQKNPLRQTAGPIAFSSMIPHSDAWFAELMKINVRQAQMTHALVQRSGSTHCCTFCGDLPAPIFSQARLPNLPARLCADCLGIRAKLHGEAWERTGAPHSPAS